MTIAVDGPQYKHDLSSVTIQYKTQPYSSYIVVY